VIAVSMSFIAFKDSSFITNAPKEADYITKVAICSSTDSNYCTEIEAPPIEDNVPEISDIGLSD
jgi:hypothetical protein